MDIFLANLSWWHLLEGEQHPFLFRSLSNLVSRVFIQETEHKNDSKFDSLHRELRFNRPIGVGY